MNSTLMNKELQHKWSIAEIKVSVFQVVNSLLNDDLVTKEDAARSLMEIIQLLEEEERSKVH